MDQEAFTHRSSKSQTEPLSTEERLRLALKAANIGLWDWDLQTNRIYFSPEWKRQIGYQDHEIPNEFAEWESRVHPDDLETATNTIQAFIANPYPNYQNEFRFRHKDGTYLWILAQADLVCDDQGNPVRMLGSHIDITERKNAELSLRQREHQLASIYDTVGDLIFYLAVEEIGHYRFTSVNQAFLSITGLQYADVVGKQIHEAIPEPPLTTVLEKYETAIRERRVVRWEETATYAIGTVTGEVSIAPIFDETGRCTHLVGAVHDITERKAAQSAIVRYNQRLAILRDIDKQIIASGSTQAISHAVLKSIQQLIHYQRASVIFIDEIASELLIFATLADDPSAPPTQMRAPRTGGQNVELLRSGQVLVIPDLRHIPPPISEMTKQALQAGLRSSITAPLMVSGQLLGYLSLASRTPDFFTLEHQEIIQEIANPLAIALHQSHLYEQIEQHNLELEQRIAARTAELQQSEARYRAIIEDQTDLVCRFLPGGILTFVNQTYCEFFNQTAEALLTTSLFDLFTESSRSALNQCIAALDYQTPVAAVEIGEGVSDEQIRWFHWSVRMLFDETGRFAEYQGVGRDITERKLAEDQLHQMLEQAMQMSELKSRYVSMAAHDLRNPLAMILSSVDMIQNYGDKLTVEQIQARYGRIQSSIKVMTDMLNDILTMGQIESGSVKFEPAPLDLNTFCQNIVEEVKLSTGTTHPITFVPYGDCAVVYADPKLLRHILSNLITNAAKYSPDETAITFTLDCGAEQILFRIHDQGIGIPKADQPGLFEAFHRGSNTKNIPGTGLGLAIVKQAVDLHGGAISFESQEGIGTIFSIVVPRTF